MSTVKSESILNKSIDGSVETKRPIRFVYWISLAFAVGAFFILPFDSLITHPDNVKSVPGDLLKFVGLSELFAHGFGVLVIALVLWTLVPKSVKFIPRIVTCALWPAIIVHAIKFQFARSRPIRYFDEQSVSHFPADQAETWLGWMPYGKLNTIYATQSFPSAHTATVWGLAIGMAWAFPKGRWLFFTIALLASMQRVISYAHWPSDVLVGAAIAFCFAGAVTQNWGLGRIFSMLEKRWAALEVSDAESIVDPVQSSERPAALPMIQTEAPSKLDSPNKKNVAA